jgi:type IV pilus assembly protein PilO
MNLSNVNLDLDNVGSWPTLIKSSIIIVLCILVAALIYYLDTQNQLAELESAQAREPELKSTYEIKQKKTVNIEEYKQQLDEIEKSFGDLLRQLPDKTQVPELLVDVSQTGLASGLEFELFKPAAEIPKDFYAELPIEIRVLGSFKEFGTFISGLASLPRIVTIHNVKIAPRKEPSTGNKNKPLVMEALVKTYRYLEEGSTKPGQDKKNRRQ